MWLAGDDECFWLCEYQYGLLICQYELGRFLPFLALLK
jgi:hypothetical protein